MENNAKVIDLNKRKTFKKYKRWFELYAKFLSLFDRRNKGKKKKDYNILKYYK